MGEQMPSTKCVLEIVKDGDGWELQLVRDGETPWPIARSVLPIEIRHTHESHPVNPTEQELHTEIERLQRENADLRHDLVRAMVNHSKNISSANEPCEIRSTCMEPDCGRYNGEHAPTCPRSSDIASALAHRAVGNQEQDVQNGKLAGYCIVCQVPWPCDTAKHFLRPSQPPAPDDARDAARYRFLRQPNHAIVYARDPNAWGHNTPGHIRYNTPEQLDAAIDAACSGPTKESAP